MREWMREMPGVRYCDELVYSERIQMIFNDSSEIWWDFFDEIQVCRLKKSNI